VFEQTFGVPKVIMGASPVETGVAKRKTQKVIVLVEAPEGIPTGDEKLT